MKILSEKEIATELGLSPWTVRTLRIQKGMPHFRTAGRIFYRLETVLRWFDAQESASSSAFEDDLSMMRRIR